MSRVESCLSQVLKISKWLRDSEDENVILFVKFWQQLNGSNSIGSLLANIIVQNASRNKLLDQKTITNLLKYCNKNGIITTKTPRTTQKHNQNNIFSFPLLCLPLDIFNQLGIYLGKNDSITLGYCTSILYNNTQNVTYLKFSASHDFVLDNKKLNKIIDLNIDPWSWSIGCTSLILKSNLSLAGIKKYTDKMRYHLKNGGKSNWWNVLLSSIKQFDVGIGGSRLLSLINIETLFSLPKNDNSWQTDKSQNTSMTLKLPSGSHSNDEIKKFSQSYNHYCKTSNIRKIDAIHLTGMGYPSSVNFDLENSLRSIVSFQPNYRKLVLSPHGFRIGSLNEIDVMFHKHLTTLEVRNYIDFDYKLVYQCLEAAGEYGKTLHVDNRLIDEFFDETKATEIKQLFGNNQENTDHVAFINDEMFDITSGGNMMYQLFDCVIDDDERETDKYKICRICLDILNMWLLKVFNQICDKCHHNGSINNSKSDSDSNANNRNNKFNNDYNGVENVTTSSTRNSKGKLDVLNSILSGDGRPNIEKLQFRDLSLGRFNDLYADELVIGSRLLNWKNSVKNLTISFLPDVVDFRVKQDITMTTSILKQFEHMVANIVQHFDKLELVTIESIFNTEKNRRYRESIMPVDHLVFSIEKWIDAIEKTFKLNTESMIKKFKTNDNQKFNFKFRFLVGKYCPQNYSHPRSMGQNTIHGAKVPEDTTKEVALSRSEMVKSNRNISHPMSKETLLMSKMQLCSDYWNVLQDMKNIGVAFVADDKNDIRKHLFFAQHQLIISS